MKGDWLLGPWPPEGQVSQEMQLGASSWGPAEVSGSSLLHQAEPVGVISSQTLFRPLRSNLESL